jgi:TDG/mug DNA glycosylase family protein
VGDAELTTMMDVLPDVLGPNLKVVFCGTAAGTASARKEAYYAGPGNKFWKIIHEIRLTDRLLQLEEFRELRTIGVGFTDIAKLTSGADTTLRAHYFDTERLHGAILSHQPRILAFNGKKAAQIYLGTDCNYGRQSQTIGSTIIHVLPSTSGAASGHWKKEPWFDLAGEIARGS